MNKYVKPEAELIAMNATDIIATSEFDQAALYAGTFAGDLVYSELGGGNVPTSQQY